MFIECPDPRNPLTDPPFYTRPILRVIPPPPRPLTPSRRLFEQWASGQIKLPHIWNAYGGIERDAKDPEAYYYDTIQRAWLGWQAAMELHSRLTSSPDCLVSSVSSG